MPITTYPLQPKKPKHEFQVNDAVIRSRGTVEERVYRIIDIRGEMLDCLELIADAGRVVPLHYSQVELIKP